jgi:hypothetical protein
MQVDAFLDSGGIENCISEKLFDFLKSMGEPKLNTHSISEFPPLGCVARDDAHEPLTVLGSTELRLSWKLRNNETRTEKFKFYVVRGIYPDIFIKPQTYTDPKFRMKESADTWPMDDPKRGMCMFNLPLKPREERDRDQRTHSDKKAANAAQLAAEERARKSFREAQRKADYYDSERRRLGRMAESMRIKACNARTREERDKCRRNESKYREDEEQAQKNAELYTREAEKLLFAMNYKT